MKKILSILCFIVLGTAMAQTPQAINYQAVATNSSGTPIANKSIGVRISILTGNAVGTNVYTETHTTNTSANGIFNVEIGRGSVQSGNFPNIQWYAQPHFAKIDIDVNGGTNYLTIGTTQFLSTPYALFAENVAMIFRVGDFFSKGHIGSDGNLSFRNDTLYTEARGGGIGLDCFVENLGGEPEELTITATGTNDYIYFTNMPQTYHPDSTCYLSGSLFISDATPTGVYPITLTASNSRGRGKSKTHYISIASCNISVENDFVGTYYGSLSFGLDIRDTLLITNPANNDNYITVNSELLGEIVCTRNGRIFTGSFSGINRILGNITVNNFAGQITGSLCNNNLSITINVTSGTAVTPLGTFNLTRGSGRYTKQ